MDRSLSDPVAARQEWAKSTQLEDAIWTLSVAACREPDMQQATMLLLPALNQMLVITTTRAIATEMHPPMIVYWMLFSSTLVASVLAGMN